MVLKPSYVGLLRGYKFRGALTIERLIEGEAGSRTAVVTPGESHR